MEFCGNLICPLLIFNAGRRAGALAAQPQCKLNWQCPLETADVTLISSALQPTLNHACLEKFNIPEANLISLRPIITAADRPWNPSGCSNESPTPAPVKLHFNCLLGLNIRRPGFTATCCCKTHLPTLNVLNHIHPPEPRYHLLFTLNPVWFWVLWCSEVRWTLGLWSSRSTQSLQGSVWFCHSLFSPSSSSHTSSGSRPLTCWLRPAESEMELLLRTLIPRFNPFAAAQKMTIMKWRKSQ